MSEKFLNYSIHVILNTVLTPLHKPRVVDRKFNSETISGFTLIELISVVSRF